MSLSYLIYAQFTRFMDSPDLLQEVSVRQLFAEYSVIGDFTRKPLATFTHMTFYTDTGLVVDVMYFGLARLFPSYLN